jgi:hypothetical protein
MPAKVAQFKALPGGKASTAPAREGTLESAVAALRRLAVLDPDQCVGFIFALEYALNKHVGQERGYIERQFREAE